MEWELDFSEQIRASKWSAKRKRSIDCDNPKGFSQKQYCKRQKRGGAYKSKGDEKRIPEKKKDGTKRPKSEHSDLYTDEDPKGTIRGLKFTTVKDAETSVRKIKASGRSHAHKTQAAIAMEQRARVAGKKAAAAVYRKFIESQKAKTKKRNASSRA